jgi:uncharacterized membrane protein
MVLHRLAQRSVQEWQASLERENRVVAFLNLLSRGRASALVTAAENEGLTESDLASLLQVSLPTVSRNVSFLVRRGLLQFNRVGRCNHVIVANEVTQDRLLKLIALCYALDQGCHSE